MSYRALIIEDDEVYRRFLARILIKKYRFNVTEAENGFTGLKSIFSDPPFLIFLDLYMPVMGGEEFLKSIRSEEKYKDIPVVVLTADGSKETVMNLAKLGVKDYILKSPDIKDTAERLDNILSNVVNIK